MIDRWSVCPTNFLLDELLVVSMQSWFLYCSSMACSLCSAIIFYFFCLYLSSRLFSIILSFSKFRIILFLDKQRNTSSWHSFLSWAELSSPNFAVPKPAVFSNCSLSILATYSTCAYSPELSWVTGFDCCSSSKHFASRWLCSNLPLSFYVKAALSLPESRSWNFTCRWLFVTLGWHNLPLSLISSQQQSWPCYISLGWADRRPKSSHFFASSSLVSEACS